MMNIIEKDIWDDFEELDCLLFTANSFIKNDKSLAMGRGIAKEVKDKFPGIDKEFGEIIMSTLYSNDSKRLHRSEYDTVKKDFSKFGLIVLGKIGAFQTKYHFKYKSELSLIEFSISMLDVYARDNPDKLIGLTFPGINYGKLSEEDVLPFLETLPDNVRVYKYAVC